MHLVLLDSFLWQITHSMSSSFLRYSRGANIFDRYGFPTDQYAQAGGSVPISAEGIGMIGTATVSGMSQAEDHAFVTEAVLEWIAKQKV